MNCFSACRDRKARRFPLAGLGCRAGMSCLLFGLIAGTGLGADTDAARVLQMKPGVAVSGMQVTLADIAANPDLLPAGWAERPIIAAPDVGKTKTVPLLKVAYALQQYPDMAHVTLRGASSMTVQRSAVFLDPARVQAAIEDFVAAYPDWQDTKITVELVEQSIPILSGSTNVSLQVAGYNYDLSSGSHFFQLDIQDPAGAVQRLKVPARLLAMAQVWVATRSIKAGAVLSADDAKIQQAATDLGASQIIPVSEPISGYETERLILAGDPILKTAVRQPICAQKGSLVDVIARRGSLTISLRAKALSRGRRGDKIICINDKTKHQILTRLTAPGKAEMIGM